MVYYVKIVNDIYFWCFVVFVVVSIYLIYMLVKRKYTIFEKTKFVKYVLYLVLINLILMMFFFDVIEVYFIADVEYSSGMFWSLLNSLVIGMILLAIGVFGVRTGNYLNYIIIILVVCLALSGMGYIGIRLVFNIPLFIWNTYDSNGIYGIWFYSLNSYLFIGLVFVSILFEKEKDI